MDDVNMPTHFNLITWAPLPLICNRMGTHPIALEPMGSPLNN